MAYLIGRVDDTYSKGMYPFVKVSEITKEDLLRCEKDEVILYDLIDNKFFNYVSNTWEKVPEHTNYKDQWE